MLASRRAMKRRTQRSCKHEYRMGGSYTCTKCGRTIPPRILQRMVDLAKEQYPRPE